VAESGDVERPIQLENFKLEPEQWLRTMYPYQLRKAVTAIVIFIVLWFGGMSFQFPEQMPLFVAIGLGLIAFTFGMRWARMRQVTRDPLNRASWQNRQIEFDDHEIRIAAADGTRSQIPIRNLVLCAEYRGFYILHLTRAQSILIAANAFKQPSDEAEFRQALYRNNLLKSIEKK